MQWFRDLYDLPKGRAGENLLWRAVAEAPAGYCHPKSAVTGSLLEDVAAGMAFKDIARRFNAKVAPLAYQRPQAAPSASNVQQAEKIVAQLGIAPSLERRFARLDEVQVLDWVPSAYKMPAEAAGVFGASEDEGRDAYRAANGAASQDDDVVQVQGDGATKRYGDAVSRASHRAFHGHDDGCPC